MDKLSRTAVLVFVRPRVGHLGRALCSLVKSGPTHVAIGDGYVILETVGARFFPVEAYMKAMESHGAFALVVQTPFNVLLDKDVPKIQPTVSVVRHLFRILIRQDCVAAVKRLLRRAGVAVPWWVVTPNQLCRYFQSRLGECRHAEG